jgi:putative oxidoreductase
MKTIDRFKAFIFYIVNDNRVILIRIIVGLIFLTEGIQKFLFPGSLGIGRFEKIGFSNPEFWAGFAATFEIICGTLVLLGLLTKLASIPLLIIMITAFITTKWPLLVTKGFWPFAHEYRTDFAMTLLLIYLLIYGAGTWSADLKLFKHRHR